jgi:hypothetical protein
LDLEEDFWVPPSNLLEEREFIFCGPPENVSMTGRNFLE